MKNLIIFEIANNHGGSVEHGKKIIQSLACFPAIYGYSFKFAIKFQMRNYATFIHKDALEKKTNKYVERFLSTALSLEQFAELKDYAEQSGFETICTPFDEESVDNMVKLGFKYAKIASCSCGDWSLMNKVVAANFEHVFISTAAASEDLLWKINSFFTNRNESFTVFHCVGEYPTPLEDSQLGQIDVLKDIFIGRDIGLSSHEEPSQTFLAPLALMKGVTCFEKHVDIEEEGFKKNAYSCNVIEIDLWLGEINKALKAIGDSQRYIPNKKEEQDLLQFKRGVFLKTDVKKGEIVSCNDFYFAWPAVEGQILAQHIEKYVCYKAIEDIKKDQPMLNHQFIKVDDSKSVHYFVGLIIDVLKRNNLDWLLKFKTSLELSHHYGFGKFEKVGMGMLTLINDVYCKKYLILLPHQIHPEQWHNQKQETFVILGGDMILFVDGVKRECNVGDIVTILPGQKHEMWGGINGAVIEEISTTHDPKDSYYSDYEIMKNKSRKTFVEHWSKWSKQ